MRMLPDDGLEHPELILAGDFEFPDGPLDLNPIITAHNIRACRIPDDV